MSTALAARLARRETTRRPWRTLLVAVLVAMPVAGMMVAAVMFRTSHLTAAEKWRHEEGLADAAISGTAGDVPPGSRVVSFRRSYPLVKTSSGARSEAEVNDLPLGDRLTSGIIEVVRGRAPSKPGEVLVSSSIARALHTGIGRELTLRRPAPIRLHVVGVGRRCSWHDARLLVVAPGAPFPRRGPLEVHNLIDLPDGVTSGQLEAWARGVAGRDVEGKGGVSFAPGTAPRTEPAISDNDNTTTKVAWSWVIGAVVFTVVGIVIASAFAASARRQLRTLGQLSANGAAPRMLRRVLFLQGTWTGAVGALLGLGLGAVALVALVPHRDAIFGFESGPWDVRWLDVVPIVAIGVAAATIAALVPARTISGVPVLAALAGRRPLGRVPAWLAPVGAAVGAGGLALLALAVLGGQGGQGNGEVWALTGMAGGVAVLLGGCALAPAYVSVLEPAASRWTGSWRLAARSLARQRTRTSAVVSAVCATAALAIAASALIQGANAQEAARPRYIAADEVHVQTQTIALRGAEAGTPDVVSPPAGLVASLRRELPQAKVFRLRVVPIAPPSPVSRGDWATIGDDAAIAVYRMDAGDQRALRQNGAVRFLWPKAVSVGAPEALTKGPAIAAASIDRPGLALGSLPRVVVTPERARELGLRVRSGDVVLRLPAPLTSAQRAAVRDVFEEYNGGQVLPSASSGTVRKSTDQATNVEWDHPNGGPDPLLVEAVLAGVALLFTLFVVAVSLALAAAETRDERDVLAVVGASPRTMRSTSGRKALLLTVMGAVLALPVGFLPVVVIARLQSEQMPLVFPWRLVATLLAVVPLVAAVATTGTTAIGLRLRPVRASTMVVD